MSGRDLVERHLADTPVGSGGDPGQGANALPAVLTGELVGMADNGRTPLVEADGERLVVDARDQLVLRCGKASITLTKAGKVLIQGTYLSSRSSGVNRIKGGSVQLN